MSIAAESRPLGAASALLVRAGGARGTAGSRGA